MKSVINNWKTTLMGFTVMGIAAYALFEGKINAEVFSGLCALAIGLLASKDGDKK